MKSSNKKKVAIAGDQLRAPLTREHTAFCEWQRNGGVEFEHTTKQLFCRSFLGSEKHLGKTFLHCATLHTFDSTRCFLVLHVFDFDQIGIFISVCAGQHCESESESDGHL